MTGINFMQPAVCVARAEGYVSTRQSTGCHKGSGHVLHSSIKTTLTLLYLRCKCTCRRC